MLLGMVINNAILLVAQARVAQGEGLDITGAVEQALKQRMRPILIGALTGVVGALPMAINPGPGAVIYRGLAAVTVGGVGLSLIFTLVLMPALLRFRWRPDALPVPVAPRVTHKPELVLPARAGNQ
jgi:multidrug efflux pump subunit AcrB